MAVAVKPDIAFDPVYLGLLSAKAVVLEAHPLADLIEKARTGCRHFAISEPDLGRHNGKQFVDD